jgi:hypothetical protein
MRKLVALIGLALAVTLGTIVLYAAASYPSSTKSFTTKTSGQTIASSHINEIQDEIVAIENGLLTGLAHVLKPLTDATYDLGASGKQWKNLYLSGSLIVGGSTVSLTPDLSTCGLRLSLTTATPYTTSDVTAATTVFVTPVKGGQCAFYDGSATWTMLTNAEASISVPGTTATIYDVWCRNNSGTIACDTTAWTNDTTRATALTTQNNVYVKTGDTTRRYIGSFRTTTVSGQTEDSVTKRYVYSYYNRADRELKRTETNNTWTHNSATIREANGSTSNQVEVVVGVNEDPVDLSVSATWADPTSSQAVFVGIGLDSTTTFAADQILSGVTLTGNNGGMSSSRYRGYAGVGKHVYSWNETVVNSGTAVTFYSNATTTVNGLTIGAAVQSGIVGSSRQ